MAEEKQKQQPLQFTEDDEPYHISTYLTKEDWNREIPPERLKELDLRLKKLTKKLAEAGVLKPRTGGNTPSKR